MIAILLMFMGVLLLIQTYRAWYWKGEAEFWNRCYNSAISYEFRRRFREEN